MSEVWFCETHNYVFNADLEIDAETAGWMWYCPDAVIDEPVCVHTKMLLVSPNSLVVEKTGLGFWPEWARAALTDFDVVPSQLFDALAGVSR